MTTILTNIKAFVTAHKIAVIAVAAAVALIVAAVGIGIALRPADEAAGGNTTATTEACESTDFTDTLEAFGSGTAEPETEAETEEETEPETETTVAETEAEPTELETEAPETEAPEAEETEPPHVYVTGLSLDKYEVYVTVGQSDMPWVTMTPANATDKSEIWTSDNTAVATVDAYGNIYGVAAGSCTVTVCSADNNNAFATVAVTVTAPETTPATTPAPETQAPETEASEAWKSIYVDYGGDIDKIPGAENVDPDTRAAMESNINAISPEQWENIRTCSYCGGESDMFHMHYNTDVICYICGRPAKADECHDCYE